MSIDLKDWVQRTEKGVRFNGRFIGCDGKNNVYGTPQGAIYVGLPASQVDVDDDGMICVPEWLAMKTQQFWVTAS